MDYKLLWDLHTHTAYSHGKGSIRDNVRVGFAEGLLGVGIADHGIDHRLFGVRESAFPRMRDEVDGLRKTYPEMRILLGIEANITNASGKLALPKNVRLDYVIAGYHFGALDEEPLKEFGLSALNLAPPELFCRRKKSPGLTGRNVSGELTRTEIRYPSLAEQIRKAENRTEAVKRELIEKLRRYNTELFLRALYGNRIQILSHPGAKQLVDIRAIADACRERGTLMEINGKHGHLDREELSLIKDTGAEFCIGSDSHIPYTVGRFEEPLRRAFDAGIRPEQIVNIAPFEKRVTKEDLPEWML